ncbi:UNVERIFIED_CONTAM: hypothetical protein Scaly_1517300 [Sesamum calycinum]|uniref:LysM domain-containing protein n=1 Tax=Sesamum calycinum TaxID=2727403 RepID=A0AAW2P746_9LAMI
MELKLSQSSLPTAIFNSSSFFTKHFTLLAQRWISFRDILQGPRHKQENLGSSGQRVNEIFMKLFGCLLSLSRSTFSKRALVEKGFCFFGSSRGENLSSISKLYGVPIHDIAAVNKDIVYVDLVSQGQHLNIPSASAGDAQGAKTTGSFLVLVPLIAFCIRCIIGACQNRVARNLRHQALNKSGVHRHPCNSMRWKTILSELREPNALDAEPEMDSDPFSEEQEQVHFEEIFHSYAKLEDDYQKFLAECGTSNWGYWRGGSPQ